MRCGGDDCEGGAGRREKQMSGGGGGLKVKLKRGAGVDMFRTGMVGIRTKERIELHTRRRRRKRKENVQMMQRSRKHIFDINTMNRIRTSHF